MSQQATQPKPGEAVVVRGMGLGTVKSVKDGTWTVRLTDDDDMVEIRAEKVDALLRRPLTVAEAQVLLDVLGSKEGDPDPRPWGEQYVELQHVLKHGTPSEQATHLQKLYRLRNLDASRQRILDSYEDALLPELASALKKKIGGLRSRLHRGQPAFGYQAPVREDDAPIEPPKAVPAGWSQLGAFRVFSGKMAVGELPISEHDAIEHHGCRATIVGPCRNGEWFAFSRRDDEGGIEYAVVHRSQLGAVAELPSSVSALGTVMIEGGTLHLLDEEVRDDHRYQRELESGADPLGRGVTLDMGGDGPVDVHGASDGEDDSALFYIRA